MDRSAPSPYLAVSGIGPRHGSFADGPDRDRSGCDLETEPRVFLAENTVFSNAPRLQGITTDSVLVAAYAAERLRTLRGEVCDLCCGSGLISLLLARRCADITLHGVDSDAEACRYYLKNAGENGLAPRFGATGCDMAEVRARFASGRFAAAVANPPYFEQNRGAASPDPARRAARQGCALETLLGAAAYLLKNGGSLWLSFPAERTAELFCRMSKAKIEPKRMRFVAHTAEKAPSIVLAGGVKGAAAGIRCEKTLILYAADGRMTGECAAMYGMPR